PGGPQSTTWAALYTANAPCTGGGVLGRGCAGIGAKPVHAPIINFACCGPSYSENAGTMGGYVEIAMAGSAANYTVSQDPRALEEWAIAVGRTAQAYQLRGASYSPDVRIDPQFSIVPK